MAHFLPVDDPDDPRVAGYRDVRDRDLQGRSGLFMAEGEVVLRTLTAAGRFTLESVLIAAKRADALADLFAALPQETPVYLAAQPVLDAIAGFPLHRGVLALGRRRPLQAADALLAACAGPAARVLALFGIGNHDNMGALFRNAAAFGAQAVLLDPACCDPLYRKAIRVSVGAALRTPYARLSPDEDALALLGRHGFEALALTPSGAEPLHRLAPPPRAALLLGAEGPGLAPALLARARTVAIPMAAGFDSLNVATAAAIALHRLSTAG
ncbi:MAG: RNA methyltransferase [Caulobacteraceae bacterium]|nr:RNA methyltransferase [Caulobacter sp.]